MKIRAKEKTIILGSIFLALAPGLFGQSVSKADTDVLELNDGERLIGHLVGAAGDSLTFHSDAAGDVKIDWSKVKSLQSSGKFALPQKGLMLDKHADLSKVPQGTISESDKKISVNPGSGGTALEVPVADVANIIPQPTFLHAFKTPKLTEDWHGSAGLGIDVVEATQKSRNITVGVSLQRVVPGETWVDPRYRTLVDLNIADSKLTQDVSGGGSQTITSNLIHGDAEHDIFFSSRLYANVMADYLHSSSQGMSLQQTYGGGLGYVVLKDEHQELDIKGAIDYIRQSFETPAATILIPNPVAPPSKSLIGASASENYTRTLRGSVLFHEGSTFIPAFNDAKYYTASAFANISVPVHKRLTITIGGIESYVNEPPAGFKKNSFEFVTQLAYRVN